MAAVTGKYIDSSDISTTLQTELEKIYGSGKVTVTKNETNNTYEIAITEKGTYKIDTNGKVEKQGPAVTYSNERIVESSDGTGTTIAAATKTPGDKLYIYFEASVESGTTSISPSVPFEITENGTYNFTITSAVNGETFTTTKTYTANQYDLRANIDVGDYINYTPDVGTYSKDKLGEMFTGNTDTSWNQNDLTTNVTADGNTTKTVNNWKVLRKYEDGSLDIIGNLTTYKVRFYGARGYNNGPKVMDDICKALYSKTVNGTKIEARSIGIEDFEVEGRGSWASAKSSYITNKISDLKNGTLSSIQNVDDTKNVVTFEITRSKYPNIYVNEKGAGINTTIVNSTENTILLRKNIDITGNQQYNQASTNGLTTEYTGYSIDISYENYGKVAYILNTSGNYWIASRGVNCLSYCAMFGLRFASNKTYEEGMFTSNWGDSSSEAHFLRPIVHLERDVHITPSATASNSTGTPHTINW